MMKIQKLLKLIKENKTFIISSHVNPDPDAICSELAMASFLKAKGKKVTIINEEEIPLRFLFLPGAKTIKNCKNIRSVKYDVLIVLDCGDLDRIGKVQALIQKGKKIVNIDHHITNDSFGDVNLVDVKASSTAEIIFELFKEGKCRLNKQIATNLYSGIMTDTGCFRYSNTTPKTHAIVSQLLEFSISPTSLYKQFYESVPLSDLKEFTKIVSRFEEVCQKKIIVVELSKQKIKKFSDSFDLRDAIFKFLRSINEAEVFVILTETEKNRTRVNLRSSGRVNVGRLAQCFNGGGHHNASGCMVEGDMKKARQKMIAKIKKEI